MNDILSGRYFTLLELLVNFLLAFGVLGGAAYLWLRWRRNGQPKDQEQSPTEGQPAYTVQHPQVSIDDLLSFVAHDFGSSLAFIEDKAKETLVGLGDEPSALADKQKGIFFAACDMQLHAENILKVFQPEPKEMALDWNPPIGEITSGSFG
jgi:hypothetical protein